MKTSCLSRGGGLWFCLQGIIKFSLVHTCAESAWGKRERGGVWRREGENGGWGEEIEIEIEKNIEKAIERDVWGRAVLLDTRELISPPGFAPPPLPLHFKLELIQTCCSWKEAIGTGSNRKMICEGIGVWELGNQEEGENETREWKRWINRGWWRRGERWED